MHWVGVLPFLSYISDILDVTRALVLFHSSNVFVHKVLRAICSTGIENRFAVAAAAAAAAATAAAVATAAAMAGARGQAYAFFIATKYMCIKYGAHNILAHLYTLKNEWIVMYNYIS